MKGNKKLLVVVALLLLLTLTFTSYAIYKSSYAGNANVTAAKWNVSFADGATTVTNNFVLTFGTSDCTGNAHVENGVIAPGAYCEKDITVDAGDTQVDVLIEASTSTPTVNGSAIPAAANPFTVTTSTDVTNDIITYDASPRTATVTVRVEWAGDESATLDPADTGLAGQTITVPVTLTAKQVVETTP